MRHVWLFFRHGRRWAVVVFVHVGTGMCVLLAFMIYINFSVIMKNEYTILIVGFLV